MVDVVQGGQAASRYGVHPGVAMMQAWVESLPTKTGRTLDEWIQLVREEGPLTEKERREWLKTRHNLGTNAVWRITERADGRGWEDDDPNTYLKAAEEYVEAMYAGPKAGLRPIYERLLEVAGRLGDDVKACPCRTMVPLYRRRVFAQITPSARTRVDFGLALGETPPAGRLLAIPSPKNRVTHRIPIAALAEVDDEVERWLRTAYDLDA